MCKDGRERTDVRQGEKRERREVGMCKEGRERREVGGGR